MAHNITKKLDVSDYSFVHLTLILLLHYLVKCRSRRLAVYNNEFILSHKNHCETTKSLKIGYLFNINQKRVYHTKISDVDELKRRINGQWAGLSPTVIECATSHQHILNVLMASGTRIYALAFVLEADIFCLLSTRCNKDEVM